MLSGVSRNSKISKKPLAKRKRRIASLLRLVLKLSPIFATPSSYPPKQLKYANMKSIPFVLVIGEDEVKGNTVTLKNMSSTEQLTLPLDQAIAQIFQ